MAPIPKPRSAAVFFVFFAAFLSAFSLPDATEHVLFSIDLESPRLAGALVSSPHLAPLFNFRIVRKYPHDPEAFTQGLIFAKGAFYESTGLNGRSSLRRVDPETGQVLNEYDLPAQYFAEGLTMWDMSLIQLTWKSEKGFVYNMGSLALEREFNYSGEGWGLTNDGRSLIMSNGTADLTFLDPKTFAQQRTLRVLDMGRPVTLLNELEYMKGKILANVWQEDFIAMISPETGEVFGWLDMSALRKEIPPGSSAETLNGIAYDSDKGRLFVTGKLWPSLFEIEILEKQEKQN